MSGTRRTKAKEDSKEWSTPAEIVLSAWVCLRGIELDPCSNEFSVVPATVVYALPEHDGLVESWDYRSIYCNPPYGSDKMRGTRIRDWLLRCRDAARAGSEVIALVPVATNTGHWKESVIGEASEVCFFHEPRLKFIIDGVRSPKGAPMAICAIYWGEHVDRFRACFATHGWFATSVSEEASMTFKPRMIISGGQTGADRGGLIAAAILGYEHGGWVPKGRLAEDGRVPDCYPMTEASTEDYPTRTKLNIECSDATIVFTYEDDPTGGSKLTLNSVREQTKPAMHMVLDPEDTTIEGSRKVARAIRAWLDEKKPEVLNIAGSRESKAPGIQDHVAEVMLLVLQTPASCICGKAIPEDVWAREGVKERDINLRCSECGHLTAWSHF